MRTITATGIVIKEVNSGEADKFITVLLKDYGKMTIFCKGARNTKSKFLAGASIFSYSEFVIFMGAKTPTLCSVSLIESFYNLRLSYDNLVCASYFTQMADKLILTDVNTDDFIRLIFIALKKLCKDDANINFVMSVFEFKFLEILGIFPASHFCGNCNKSFLDFVDENKVFFDLNGLICYNCSQKSDEQKILVDYSTIYVINYILDADIKDVFNFTTSEETLLKLKRCVKLFIKENIDETFKSLEFLNNKGDNYGHS